MKYRSLEQSLYKYTNGWSTNSGEFPLGDRKSIADAEHILKQHYVNVNRHHLDTKRIGEDGMTDYKIKFDTPKENEDDELQYIPDRNPSAGPMGKGTGMVEDYDDTSVLESLLNSDDVITDNSAHVLEESSTSRIYKHLSDDNTCAIISAFRSENNLETNLDIFRSLKKDVRGLGLGYVEFTSRWVEDDETFDEKSLLIPSIEFNDANNLSTKYLQSSFIFKDGNSCKEYCTHDFENYRRGDVVRTFNNVGKNMLNLESAKEIFAKRKAGPASRAKYVAPFNLQVIEKFDCKPSTFRGCSEYVVLNIHEAIEKHDELNPKLFRNNELRPEVKTKLIEIVDKFKKNLKEDEIELDIKDVIIVGSAASYNYTNESDIDLHIIADMDVYDDHEILAQKLYDAYKRIFNSKYDIMIRGHEVEIYVDPDENHARSNAQYSLYTGWIKSPDKNIIPEVDMDEVNYAIEPYEERYNEIIDSPNIEDIDNLIDDLYVLRQSSIISNGEYSIGNLVFKEMRNRGYLQRLKNLKVELESEEMSLE